ncbi:glycosyltransferase family 39 protein [Candidatus Gottesmanbacteria bacterium]|nr:glycosyltransferase family 39 protein [Candidatus Gottesmanbacteria bacterium]
MFDNTPLLYLTQSLWRDEAFSVLVASPGGFETIRITSSDYSPPLYYLFLHYWMLVFGKAEITIRVLSLIFFIGFLYIFYQFAKAIFKDKWAKVSLLLAAFNPMLVYYAFEARGYSLNILTTTASMYYFYINKPLPYIIATTLALYTHPYTVIVPVVQGLYLLISKKLTKEKIITMVIPFILYTPWMFVIADQLTRTEKMWMWPINLTLILSVLGNLLIGYEGTPGFLWKYTIILSVTVFVLYIFAISTKKRFKQNILFFLWVFVPLAIVLIISYFKPIFVNRYLITVSSAQVMLLAIALKSIKTVIIKRLLTVFFFGIWLYSLYFLPPYIKKVDVRTAFAQINTIANEEDFVYANTPLVFFESVYYYKNPTKVYLFNPQHIILPNYLAIVLIPNKVHKDFFPKYPARTFMIYEDGHYEIFSGFPDINK